MPNCLFKKDIPNNIIFDFLIQYCPIENDYFILDKLIFKQYEYNDLLTIFYDSIKDNYKDSKRNYLDREKNYNNLLTILRQICKNNNIPYYSKIRYDKNKYYIIYYIKNISM